MAAGYAVWLCDDRGERIQPIDDILKFDYVKVINGVGWFDISLGQNFNPDLFQLDRQIHIERRPRYRDRAAVDFVGLLRYWEYRHEAGVTQYIISGPDQNDILTRRIVAYAADTANAKSSAVEADDALKDIFNTNFIGGAPEGRNLASLGVTVQADATAGAVITKNYAWRNAYTVMQEIAEAAKTAGGEIFFGLEIADIDETTGQVSFEFRTTVGAPRQVLTVGGGLPAVIFGREFGNVTAATLSFDYRDESNYIYAGGQGEGLKRYIAESSDSTRIGGSRWNRRELFADARNEETTAAVDDVADSKLSEGRPKVRFEATLQDTEQARYGVDWDLGDKVTIVEFGRRFDGFVRRVHVKYDGKEAINVKVASEDV